MITHTDLPPVANMQKASEAIIKKSKELKVFSMKTKLSKSQSYRLVTFKILNAPQVLNGKLDISEKEASIKVKTEKTEIGPFGKLVSQAFAIDAIHAYEEAYNETQGKVENHTKRIFFSKAQVELILSQENCEGISIFFGLPPSKKNISDALSGKEISADEFKRELSVILLGNDINGYPLKNMSQLSDKEENEMIIVEVGGPPPYL